MTGDAAALTGRRILVAEDEFMIAKAVAMILEACGAEVLGPASSLKKALNLATRSAEDGRIDAALLDVNLRGEAVWPVVDALRERDVPVVLASGYNASVIPAPYAHLPRFQKPADPRDLIRALATARTS